MTGHLFQTSNSQTIYRLDRPQVGLIAGWGQYPIEVATALRRQGKQVICVGAKGHADPALQQICDQFVWLGLGRMGSALRFFKQHGVRDATMAGKIFKVKLFDPWAWVRYMPDLRTIRFMLRLFRRDLKDDTILTSVVNEFAQEGIRFQPATDFAPELLVKPGKLTRTAPTDSQLRDIEFGWKLAKEMGRLDVGQSVVVKDRAVIAVEAIEGTDVCIRRAGMFCRAGKFTVVKVAKPNQDMRFDVPTIGIRTLETIVAAGGKVLAIEADRSIILDQQEVIRFADRHRLSIVAYRTTPQGELVHSDFV